MYVPYVVFKVTFTIAYGLVTLQVMLMVVTLIMPSDGVAVTFVMKRLVLLNVIFHWSRI